MRKQGPEFEIYGTPWYGEAAFGSPREAILERIFSRAMEKRIRSKICKGSIRYRTFSLVTLHPVGSSRDGFCPGLLQPGGSSDSMPTSQLQTAKDRPRTGKKDC